VIDFCSYRGRHCFSTPAFFVEDRSQPPSARLWRVKGDRRFKRVLGNW
jgi:hypothetical protein